MCFSRHFVAPHHPRPTALCNHLVLVKKLLKMVGNSASKPLKRTQSDYLVYIYRLMENCVDEAQCILEIHIFKKRFLIIYNCTYKTPFTNPVNITLARCRSLYKVYESGIWYILFMCHILSPLPVDLLFNWHNYIAPVYKGRCL